MSGMILQIDDSMSIEEVEDRFTECFPFLKIAFYFKPHKKYHGSDNRDLIKGKMRIGDIRRRHYNGAIEIKSWYTPAKIEKELKTLFGLNAQIFRGDGKNGWVQTSLSDDLTLQQQNDIALQNYKI